MSATQPYIPKDIPELPSTENLDRLRNKELLLRMTIATDRYDMLEEFQWKLPESAKEARKKVRELQKEATSVISLLASHITL